MILNRVRPTAPVAAEVSMRQLKKTGFDEATFRNDEMKKQKTFTLSGTVRDGISEIWWTFESHHYQIFSNADFLYLSGIGNFEDQHTKYSVFSIVTEGNKSPALNTESNSHEEWQPTRKDFTSGQLEYYIVNSSGIEEIDAEALKPIIVMLEFYRDNFEQIKMSYENAQKIRIARDAYLKTNPRKKRNVIINSAPIDKHARKTISQ